MDKIKRTDGIWEDNVFHSTKFAYLYYNVIVERTTKEKNSSQNIEKFVQKPCDSE
jgi:hypothetical protein